LDKLDIVKLGVALPTLIKCVEFSKIAKFFLEFDLDEIIRKMEISQAMPKISGKDLDTE